MTEEQGPNDKPPELPPELAGFHLVFGTPRRLPKAAGLPGRVAVLDIAFAGEAGGRRNTFDKTTRKLIDALGERLAAWVDHHDSAHHAEYRDDPRFTLATKAEHGACPEMIDEAVVTAAGRVDTIVCHTDFDGIVCAAKWILGGREPYPGADADARAVDTRIGLPSPRGAHLDRALRARPRDEATMLAVAQELVAPTPAAKAAIDAASADLEPREAEAARLARGYRQLSDDLCLVDVGDGAPYDKTWLLLLGQQRAKMAAVVDGDTVTFAAPFDSGVDFLAAFGISGGMPTLVSIHRPRLRESLAALGVDEAVAQQF
ncbi:MAG: hypothetical protein KC731_17845 [Myxococcales bacterium]|nr:hypothetical protein [Myxococcales bacterium]